MRKILILMLICCLIGKVFSQDTTRKFFAPSSEFNNTRYISTLGLEMAGYTGSLVWLSSEWYKNYSHSSFHFFNDDNEWLQMDKCGHMFTSYQLGRMGIDMMEWSGADQNKNILIGGVLGFAFLGTVEIMDGFSSEWGFSWGDFTANTLGAGLITGQTFLKKKKDKTRFANGISDMSLKFSFSQTIYPPYRPGELGKNLSEEWLKDYNGQSYWMSFNLHSFMNEETKFPHWLNVAFGYGAEGMTGGKSNPIIDANGNPVVFERYRQYYLSLDIDLTKIKTRSRFLKTVFETFSFIKIPAPSLEFNKHGMIFHPVYY